MTFFPRLALKVRLVDRYRRAPILSAGGVSESRFADLGASLVTACYPKRAAWEGVAAECCCSVRHHSFFGIFFWHSAPKTACLSCYYFSFKSRHFFFFCINSYLSKIGSCALASPIFGIFRRCFFSELSALPLYFVGANLLQIINMVARSFFLSVELAALQLQRQTVVF